MQYLEIAGGILFHFYMHPQTQTDVFDLDHGWPNCGLLAACSSFTFKVWLAEPRSPHILCLPDCGDGELRASAMQWGGVVGLALPTGLKPRPQAVPTAGLKPQAPPPCRAEAPSPRRHIPALELLKILRGSVSLATPDLDPNMDIFTAKSNFFQKWGTENIMETAL